MVWVKPFKGLLYNQNKIENVKSVVAPPYDVISKEEQLKLYKTSPYNIVRLILGKEFRGDTPYNNRYTRSARYLNNWLNKNILEPDKEEVFYIYAQDYIYQKAKKTRYGLIALMKLENIKKSKVLPHENTSRKPKEDRSRLLEAVKANLSPIFMIFKDEQKQITSILNNQASSKPYFDFTSEKVRHRLWRLRDKKIITRIQALFKPKTIFIADGHHRYEVALSFSHIYNYVMVYLAGLNDHGLTILPTHRVVKLPYGLTYEKMLQQLGKFFKIEEIDNLPGVLKKMKESSRKNTFGLFLGKHRYFILTLNKFIKPEKNNHLLGNLDVTILHSLIFKKILKIEKYKFNPTVIAYTREENLALKWVGQGKYDLAFFLNPTKLSEVRDMALSKCKMPHKSTYFYPKPLSGLVINKFN